MPVIDYEQLRQAMKPDLISQEACNFANQLIAEYHIINNADLAEWMNEHHCNSHRALRLWAQRQLLSIDKDETRDEQYRQIRHLFQHDFSNFLERVY